ncbi:hypothetical protein [Rhodopirellula europaea]|nr:hypothetical protein [Rhodopirellula europaea]EMI24848.1 signal peptide protein [Rhodopirellula europaea SH398]
MKTWLGMFAILAVAVSSATGAEPLPPEGCSRIKLTFVLPPELPQKPNQTMTNVGGLVLPMESIRPVSIFIDGQFTGHTLASPYAPMRPDIHLTAGEHEFDFKCDGFAPVKIKLTVLANQCTQYLIVKMTEASNEKTAVSKTKTKAKTHVVGRDIFEEENVK